MNMTRGSKGNPWRNIGWLALGIIGVLALTIVAAPVFIIQPFRAQTPRGIAFSYTLRSWSPYLTVGALIIAFVLVCEGDTGHHSLAAPGRHLVCAPEPFRVDVPAAPHFGVCHASRRVIRRRL